MSVTRRCRGKTVRNIVYDPHENLVVSLFLVLNVIRCLVLNLVYVNFSYGNGDGNSDIKINSDRNGYVYDHGNGHSHGHSHGTVMVK